MLRRRENANAWKPPLSRAHLKSCRVCSPVLRLSLFFWLGPKNSCGRVHAFVGAAPAELISFQFRSIHHTSSLSRLLKRKMARRYTVLIADRSSGVVRRLTISLRVALLGTTTIVALPLLIGLGGRWATSAERHQLAAMNNALEIENGNYRETTGELTSQIQSLEDVI